MTRAVLTFAVVAACFVALLSLFAQWQRRAGMFFPDRHPIGAWQLPARVEETTFRTTDGVQLHAWMFRSGIADAPLIIWYHGNAGNLTYRVPMARELAARGIDVFLFDYRGFGKSEGSASESKLYIDAIAAFDFATKTYATGRSVILYGESIGGPYAAFTASKRQACGVILENSFPSLAELANALYGPLPLGILVPGAMTTTKWLRNAHVPVLVMHSKGDRIIPFRLGQAIYDGLEEPKEMFISEQADHSEIPAVENERYYAAIVTFARTHCGGAK